MEDKKHDLESAVFTLIEISGESQLFSLNLHGWHFVIFLARVMIFGMLNH